jgi:hypothetical protein
MVRLGRQGIVVRADCSIALRSGKMDAENQ